MFTALETCRSLEKEGWGKEEDQETLGGQCHAEEGCDMPFLTKRRMGEREGSGGCVVSSVDSNDFFNVNPF